MKLTFIKNPREILQIDDARITFKNFAGVKTPYNDEGNKNFSLIIDDVEIADALIEHGWNVKIKQPRDMNGNIVDGDPFMHLKVNVKFNRRGPKVYLRTGRKQVELDEESIAILDDIDIEYIEMDIRPYDWRRFDGSTGRTAYLEAMRVTQRADRFAADYDEDM